ncbi:glycosyltransferase family 4 protein [Aetokthonos hydrillicola Thurmond2011]|jgi:glycosyltransferase involved in cell wall biosynthesis|uniref:Glycosyltransferase family 4 protein n=1 Tax=Aetokthonos hydrillicola Thurmond2011 TaxID=2712845 RepID=A0AAP5IG45_9CYAN|nr:glycosyltransferase family 4 protein [Aetokthonos hydrillicola]MBO3461925.1 glycosyltransferase family 4 protein [Aetokthonos hydrillicola CCALA 1050]MBW4585410.1 glycosyltransferase family 4 protein [Aetokthonos hydrillicola CCALA 1050]MDR9899083.1 glycosyltransferase family 4 protein [Aetokthonos hydrillicola Thurmond2011]
MKSKVSLVVSDLSGGGAIRAFLLGQVLKKLDYEVEIAGFLFGKELFAIPPEQIPIVSFPGKNYPEFFKYGQKLLEELHGDIIYAVKPKFTSFGLSLLKKFINRRPLLLDMDDWELSWYGGFEWKYRPTPKQLYRDIFKQNGALKFPDHPLYLQLMERFVKQADALTIDTQFLQERFGGVYLPNGKDTSLFDPDKYNPVASRKTYGLSEYRILMFPGAPRPHKGVEDVLLALDKLNQSDLRLVIVGGNPYDNYDEQLMKKWGRWIIKLPKFPVDVMPEVVAAAHIVVVPQRDTVIAHAQFPLKLTDGMAMAKPVISTRVGDIPEILAETGYLVNPASPEQIAEKIQLIFENLDSANERGKQARLRCIEKYSTDTMASTLAEVMGKL